MPTIPDRMALTGRVALITGGAGELGRAFAETLAELGADLCLLDLNGDKAEAVATDLSRRYGIRATGLAVDVTREADLARTVAHLTDQFGRLDVLINNAAYPPSALPPDGLALTDQSLGRWALNLETMLTGTFLTTKACCPLLAAHGQGSIINVASIYGLVGPDLSLYEGTTMTNPAAYAAAKGGIVQLTRHWATSLAPAIRVNGIAPGGVGRDQPAAFTARYEARTPLGRMATADDLVGAVAYFAGDLSRYVTGQILAIDGGWTAW